MRWTRALVLGTAAFLAACGDPPAPSAPEFRLAFVVQPTRAATDSVISPAPQVAIRDLAGRIDLTNVGPVTIALSDNGDQSTLHGTLAVNAVEGIAVFNDLRISRAATLTLIATAPDARTQSSIRFRVFPRYSSIAAGSEHSCATSRSGPAYCWGRTLEGQLGTVPATGDTLLVWPVASPPGVSFEAIGAGSYHSCGLDQLGAVYCWGENLFSQSGNDHSTPVPVSSPGVAYSRLSVGHQHNCALSTTGAAYCWGTNPYGGLGDGTTVNRNAPVAVSLPPGITLTDVSAGFDHTCGLTSSGTAYCWGRNDQGSLGDGTTLASPTPRLVSAPDGVSFSAISAGGGHTCGLTNAGAAYCWGRNSEGQLGDGTKIDKTMPVLVAAPAGVGFLRITAGSGRTCGVAGTAGTFCWGYNSLDGLLGDGTTIDKLTPVPVATPTGVSFSTVTLGRWHSCALTESGVAYCWGNNSSGQLADTTGQTRITPVQMGQ